MNDLNRKVHIFYCLLVGIPGIVGGIWLLCKILYAAYNQYIGFANYEPRAFAGMFIADALLFFFGFYATRKGVNELKVSRKD